MNYPFCLPSRSVLGLSSGYRSRGNLWKNKDTDDAGLFLLVSLDKLTKEENECCNKFLQLLVSQNAVKDNNELSEKIDWLQTLVFSTC